MRSCFLSSCVEFRLMVSEERSKMSQPIWGKDDHLVFSIGPKNTNKIKDIDISLPVKFRWIPLSGLRGEVENVSDNRRPGGHLVFPDRPEKHKLGRGHWDLTSCHVSFNSVQRFKRRSWKCISQSKTRAAICSSDRPEQHKFGRWRWDLASCSSFVELVPRFQRRSRKCYKLTTTGGRTDNGQRVITILHLSLRLRCTKMTTVCSSISLFMLALISWISSGILSSY